MKSLEIIEHIATFNRLSINKIHEESQNSEYEGMTLLFGGSTARSRLAKKTPTKKVTLLYRGKKMILIKINLLITKIVQNF